jgi:hypothetical protein
VYQLQHEDSEPLFVLAKAEPGSSLSPGSTQSARLRVVVWASPVSGRFYGTSLTRVAASYIALTRDQLEPKHLMERLASGFNVSASSIDGASTASLVAASQGQALSMLLQSRFLWWFAALATVLGLFFTALIVLAGSTPLKGLSALVFPLAVGAWGLVTTRRNWRRRTNR